jgi:hypothetical protein
MEQVSRDYGDVNLLLRALGPTVRQQHDIAAIANWQDYKRRK